jgi:hypothetical protein
VNIIFAHSPSCVLRRSFEDLALYHARVHRYCCPLIWYQQLVPDLDDIWAVRAFGICRMAVTFIRREDRSFVQAPAHNFLLRLSPCTPPPSLQTVRINAGGPTFRQILTRRDRLISSQCCISCVRHTRVDSQGCDTFYMSSVVFPICILMVVKILSTSSPRVVCDHMERRLPSINFSNR